MKHIRRTERFYHEGRKGFQNGFFVKVIIFLGVLFVFSSGVEQLSQKTVTEQKKSMEDAIWRGITQCYAIEGRYPQNLEYLKREYGVQYDSDKFFVDYQVLGENIMPDVTIIEK